jgi:hypothetical protein
MTTGSCTFVVMVSALTTSIESWAVAVALLESVTITVNVEVPMVVGVPDISPEEAGESPTGRLPLVIDHV